MKSRGDQGNGRFPAAVRDWLFERARSVAPTVAFWATIGFLFAVSAHFAIAGSNWGQMLKGVVPLCIAWGLSTPVIFAADRRLVGRMSPLWRVLCHIPLAMVLIPIPMTLDYAVRKAIHAPWLARSLWASFAQQSMLGAASYAIAVGVSIARSYRSEADRREREAAALALRAAQLENQLTEARLHTLQAQLNPHFLFNALNTVSAFTETDPKLARQMMASLGKLLRASLDHAATPEVTVEDEIAFLSDYLTIERVRFEGRLTIDVRVQDNIRRALVPTFVLQPLVENAIRHGAGVLRRKSHIDVSVSQSGERWTTICVEDDGAGLPDGWRLEDHGGIGLSNIARRLGGLYGAEHSFTVTGRTQGGVRVEITLPLRHSKAAPSPRVQWGTA